MTNDKWWWSSLVTAEQWFQDARQVAQDSIEPFSRLIVGLAEPDRWRSFRQFYQYLDSFSDAKLRGWPLMRGPCEPLTILALYFVMVYYGRRYAARGKSVVWKRSNGEFVNRIWFSLILVLYNVSMSALNAWISFELLYCGIKRQYNFLCQLVYTGTDDPYEQRIAEAIWWYFASKGIELLDTAFIIAKRKSAQLSFLHIYHHSSMFAVWWVGAKFVPGGSALSGAFVNCVVHVIMYAYYALSSAGPLIRPYLWWKKYLTILQLIQFTAGVTLGLNSIFTQCPFTRWMQYVFVAYAFSFLVLFGNFYRRTYHYHSVGSDASRSIIKNYQKLTQSKQSQQPQQFNVAKNRKNSEGNVTRKSSGKRAARFTMLKASRQPQSLIGRRKQISKS